MRLRNPGEESIWALVKCCCLLAPGIRHEQLTHNLPVPRIPSMSAWLEMSYSTQPLLQYGDFTILSCSGVQKGDPLRPLGFALALHPLVEKINEQVPGLVINAWYLDDGTLCGSARDLHAALTIIEREGPALGLQLGFQQKGGRVHLTPETEWPSYIDHPSLFDEHVWHWTHVKIQATLSYVLYA